MDGDSSSETGWLKTGDVYSAAPGAAYTTSCTAKGLAGLGTCAEGGVKASASLAAGIASGVVLDELELLAFDPMAPILDPGISSTPARVGLRVPLSLGQITLHARSPGHEDSVASVAMLFSQNATPAGVGWDLMSYE